VLIIGEFKILQVRHRKPSEPSCIGRARSRRFRAVLLTQAAFNWLTDSYSCPASSPPGRVRSWRSAGCHGDDGGAKHGHVRAGLSILSASEARWMPLVPRGWPSICRGAGRSSARAGASTSACSTGCRFTSSDSSSMSAGRTVEQDESVRAGLVEPLPCWRSC